MTGTQLDLAEEHHSRPRLAMPLKPYAFNELIGHDGLLCGVEVEWRRGSRKLCWLTPAQRKVKDVRKDQLVQRLTRWSYRWGYGGFVLISLYPCRITSVLDVLDWAKDQAEGERKQAVLEHMRFTVHVAREARCRNLVVATGPLTEPWMVDDMEVWLNWWRTKVSPRGWYYLGTNEAGWPVAPVSKGLTPPADDVEPQIWRPQQVRQLLLRVRQPARQSGGKHRGRPRKSSAPSTLEGPVQPSQGP